MFVDKFGQIVLSEDDMCNLLMSNPIFCPQKLLTTDDVSFDPVLELEQTPNIVKYVEPNIDFDTVQQSIWKMPNEYKTFDIAKYVLDCCTNDEELQRVGEELLLYQDYNLFDLLRYLKYLVDTMRKNNIVWGVGRGSSVASYVLFLLGVHKINSLYYDIPITEFLRNK